VADIGTSTVQSRALAGLANGTLVCCLPGSTNAVQIRRFSHSISYCVSVVRPLHRPESSNVVHFVEVLRSNCQRISAQLQNL